MIRISTTQVWVHDQDEALAFWTEKAGFEVREDVTIAELGNFRWLTVAPPGQTDIAIVLSDIIIPGGMNGRQLAAAVRQRRPDMRLLLISGYSDEAADSDLSDDLPVLAKPFFREELARALQKAK